MRISSTTFIGGVRIKIRHQWKSSSYGFRRMTGSSVSSSILNSIPKQKTSSILHSGKHHNSLFLCLHCERFCTAVPFNGYLNDRFLPHEVVTSVGKEGFIRRRIRSPLHDAVWCYVFITHPAHGRKFLQRPFIHQLEC